MNGFKIPLAAIAAAVSAACAAERVVTSLDGNDWMLDGLPVLVPNCWNKIDGADGAGWRSNTVGGGSSVEVETYAKRRGVYSRPLPDAKENRRYFIRCGGAGEKAIVRVNGVEIGSHAGAFTGFTFEATGAMKSAGNILEIEVTNEYDADVPPLSADFDLCGGLYRSVELIETDPVCIDPTIDGGPGVKVFPEMDGTVRVEVDVSGADDATIDWEPKKIDNPKLWSPEEPNLYKVRVTVSKDGWSDTVVETFGFRTAELREDGFYLNGVKRKVRGVNRHQDLEGMGWEMTPAQEELDFRLIKAMGADAVRLAHYPQSRNVYDVCDSLGIMVWSEIPVVNGIGGAKFRENARQAMREMVAQHRNHPSVCWWGCWNELYNISKKRHGEVGDWEGESAALEAFCRGLDSSRPIVAAACKLERKDLNSSVENICYNLYPGWYVNDTFKEMVDTFMARNNLSLMGISEYGAGGSISQHQNPVKRPGPGDKFHPEEYMTNVHIDDYRAILADDRLWGSFVWVMFDFAADARREGDRDGINDKGLVTRDRVTAKDSYFFYKANWRPEPMVHLCGKRMRKAENDAIDVVAFSNVGEVTLVVNGKIAGRAMPDGVKTVRFEGVKLGEGENTIRVEAHGLADECVLAR